MAFSGGAHLEPDFRMQLQRKMTGSAIALSGYDGLAAVVASKTFRGGQHRNGGFRRLEKLAPAKTQISGSGSRKGGNSLSP